MHSLISFASNPNADVRQAALHCLLEVARNCGDGEESTTPEETSALRKVLGDRIDEISRLNPEDLAALKEERHLVDALWQLLFHEPSKLRKEGLLGLPEDDETPPEVAVRSPSLLEASRIRPPDVAQAKDVPVLRLGVWRLVYDVHPWNDVLKSYGVWNIFSAGMFPHLSVTVVAVNKWVTLFELRIYVKETSRFCSKSGRL